MKLELESSFHKSTKLVLTIDLSFAVGIVNPEDRRSNFDVVSDLEVVVTLNGEVGFVIGFHLLSIGGVAGVRAEAQSKFVAFDECIVPVEANHPARQRFGIAAVFTFGITEVDTCTDGGDKARISGLPVATKTDGMHRMAKVLAKGVE